MKVAFRGKKVSLLSKCLSFNSELLQVLNLHYCFAFSENSSLETLKSAKAGAGKGDDRRSGYS